MEKLVLFGAGKIGRSFIGQLFSRSGYEVVFIDINKTLIDELTRKGRYNVIIRSEKDEILEVNNVRGIHIEDIDLVSDEIASATILGISVGLRGLDSAIPAIAKGLLRRFEIGNHKPVDLIIAENMRNAADYFHKILCSLLPETFPLDEMVGLIETSIGKMVPIMLKRDVEEDLLQVFAEQYNTLILDKKAFKNPIPDVKGLDPKDNIKAWIDRKLFIHNLGHSAVAYYGYSFDNTLIYTWQALKVPEIYNFVRITMLQAADILKAAWPEEFSSESLTEHIDDLLTRFANRYLGDTIFRVGCDLFRKLGPEDRIIGAIRMAQAMKLPYNRILYVFVCACHFRATDETGEMFPGDIDFIRLYERGIRNVLTEVCCLSENPDKELIASAEKIEKAFFSQKTGNTH